MTAATAQIMGRPQKEIDEEQVRALAMIQCTLEEMAFVLGCSVDTIERRFADIVEVGKGQGRMSLRRMQWASAKNGSVTMQIFLGKNLLGQREMAKIEHEMKDGKGLALADEYDYSQLSLEELKKLEELTGKAVRRPPMLPDVPAGAVEVKAITNGSSGNGSNGNGTHVDG